MNEKLQGIISDMSENDIALLRMAADYLFFIPLDDAANESLLATQLYEQFVFNEGGLPHFRLTTTGYAVADKLQMFNDVGWVTDEPTR